MLWIRISVLLPVVYAIPASHILRKVAESNMFDDSDNYFPRSDIIPSFDFLSNDLDNEFVTVQNTLSTANSVERTKRTEDMNKSDRRNLYRSHGKIPSESSPLTTPTEDLIVDSEVNITTIIPLPANSTDTDDTFEIITSVNSSFNSVDGLNRFPRQELNETEDDPEFASKENQSQEGDSDEDNGNMITGLLSAFLGGLSRPDGSIDLEAIIGLLGSLSTQNPDGTYNFQGLTDLLQAFFGGGDDGGGSDIGAFVGGLLGAVIKGVANPPGPKGAGILTGKIVSGVLPALSVPVNTNMTNKKKPPQEGVLDSGSFLGGLLKTVLGASGGNGGGGGVNIVQSIITSVKSFFTASSKSH